jgi:hypothetical protein
MHIDQSLCKLLFVQLTDCIFNPIITEILNPKPGVDVSGFSADVYSFGVVVWEIVTCDWPHKDRCLPSDAAASSCVPLIVLGEGGRGGVARGVQVAGPRWGWRRGWAMREGGRARRGGQLRRIAEGSTIRGSTCALESCAAVRRRPRPRPPTIPPAPPPSPTPPPRAPPPRISSARGTCLRRQLRSARRPALPYPAACAAPV